jgi:hypothetical protein
MFDWPAALAILGLVAFAAAIQAHSGFGFALFRGRRLPASDFRGRIAAFFFVTSVGEHARADARVYACGR